MGTNEAEDLVTFVDELMMPVRKRPSGRTPCFPRSVVSNGMGIYIYIHMHYMAATEEPDYWPSESAAFWICGAHQLALCLQRRHALRCSRFWDSAPGKCYTALHPACSLLPFLVHSSALCRCFQPSLVLLGW